MAAVGSQTLGLAVPPFIQHAISVSLPTWRDNVGYEEGEKRVLASICEQKFGIHGERCLLCPSKKIADHCRSFILDRALIAGTPTHVRLVQYFICPEGSSITASPQAKCAELHIVLFPAEILPIAKQFWQHTGLGISSRLAEHCLSILPGQDPQSPQTPSSPPLSSISPRPPFKALNKHYSVKHTPRSPSFGEIGSPVLSSDDLTQDQSTYLEERYGRNLPLSAGAFAKRALRRRIAGVLVRDNIDDSPQGPCAGAQDVEIGPSSRGVRDVTEDDVFLYPTGMSAIWNAHQLALRARPANKSVCFGFPYTDTLKILQKWGPGAYFFGHGLDSDIDALESLLSEESSRDPSNPPVLALFTEFPSNPLLRSADIPRLRTLADKYDFLLVIDDTIGNFINVEVFPYTDIVVSSLSKIFSGESNAMGGSLVLNPKGRHYTTLKSCMTAYEDTYFDEDALFMERNSRDFAHRIRIIDENTQAVCAFLRSRSAAEGMPSPAIKEAFFDTLACLKGPSLGTNFTLACPYTILAHYTELPWAAQYGVEEEDKDKLLRDFDVALKAAEAAK
ncbi:pyridoxal phosphate-dependent transferase [Melanogaster broomeanus]|nr:pyridoxal phosphate-dependent transferase [Melanogaster broomeanus]